MDEPGDPTTVLDVYLRAKALTAAVLDPHRAMFLHIIINCKYCSYPSVYTFVP